jgi:lysine-N-methylase
MALRHTPILRPNYAERFQCIGPACEDTCCARWSIHVDKPACDKFASLPDSPLRTEILTQIQPLPPNQNGATFKAHFPLTLQQICPFHDNDNLCRIQKTLGENYLPQICANYPRLPMTIDNLEEKPLTLSCPEAARLILLDKNLLAPDAAGHYQFNWDDSKTEGTHLTAWFWPIREFSLRLVANRNYPLWQRLFLLGLFTRRLDSIVNRELDPEGYPLTFGKLLSGFEASIRANTLRTEMEKIPANLKLQLDLVLVLVAMRLKQAFANPRTTQMLTYFLDGIGYTPDSKLPALVTRYQEAYNRWYSPLIAREPQLLENFLTNQIFRSLFPFGREGLNQNPTPALTLSDNFAQFVTYYALIKGLLIGTAGYFRGNFSAAHALAVIQIASRHFEHQPAFLDEAQALIVRSGNNTPKGFATLVRN